MADELQALLDRITEQELKKVDAEREQILAQAKADAAEIVKNAKAEAEAVTAKAQQDADSLTQKGEDTLRQASRDVLLSLRSELEKRVTKTVEAMMRETLAGENLAEVIVNLITQFLAKQGETDQVQLLVSPAELATLERAVKARVTEDLRKNCNLAPSAAVTGGFKLVFKNAGVMYDFTDQALAEAVGAYLSPQISAKL
ncbi:MAG TPA: hypothetical protein PLE92_03370 [Lentisphaeria bacterium]|nr:hypothetical protein [Lentisphaerota bacterium]OQC15236.1 MAG: V-type ATP synthase subunit E [Lentisphaerae bacterium ADurb.Bin082]HPY90638.1 hypothetical protein [Lentisphaeria bacterium]HQC52146.1 hypothetical protein [Lentisphaeria bacterium]HQL88381.1 hypothetical protein [Lentisphaeria bacterium]